MHMLYVHFRCTPAIVTVQYDTHVYGVTQRDVGIDVMTGLLLLDLLVRIQDRLHVLVVRFEAKEIDDHLLDSLPVDALLQLVMFVLELLLFSQSLSFLESFILSMAPLVGCIREFFCILRVYKAWMSRILGMHVSSTQYS